MTKEKYSYGYAQEMYKSIKQKEKEFDFVLEKGCYYVIRFDGKEMTKTFKVKHQAINKEFFNTMKNVFYEFCETYKKIIFAYLFSDEISILIKGNGDRKKIYDRMEKLLSLMSCKLALLFDKYALINKLDIKNNDFLFDARIIKLTKIDVLNYFLARQAYAIDKYIMQLKGEYKIDYKLNNSKQVLNQLKEQKIEYNNLPAEYRYGLIYSKFDKVDPFEFDRNKNQLKELCFSNNKSEKRTPK